MMNRRRITALAAPALWIAGCLVSPVSVSAADSSDAPEITALLGEAKGEATELKQDSEDLNGFVRTRLSWQSHASKVERIKEHVNNAGVLLKKLKDLEPAGSPWQQTAIRRIEPLLRELADNTERTIRFLNENPGRIHFSGYQEYVKANYEMATDLEELIRDFVNYGEIKDKLERLARKLEVSG